MTSVELAVHDDVSNRVDSEMVGHVGKFGSSDRGLERHCFKCSTSLLLTAEFKPGNEQRNLHASLAHSLKPA